MCKECTGLSTGSECSSAPDTPEHTRMSAKRPANAHSAPSVEIATAFTVTAPIQ